MKKRTFVMLLALVLLFGCATGGTLAWLTAASDVKVNTFTTSNIEIELTETTSNYKMVPGCSIDKNPTLTVKQGSETCYLFAKLEKANDFDDFMTYTIDTDEWTKLADVENVYYQVVDKNDDADQSFHVLVDDKVYVKDTVTAAMMEDAVNNEPTLTVSGFACQYYNGNDGDTLTYFTAAEAWAKVAPSTD